MPPLELIKLVPLFSGLPIKALERIAASAQSVNYLENDTIIGTGEPGDALYIITQGRVQILININNQLEAVAELGAGDFFGEMALLGDHVRKADVHAITTCTLLRIRSQDVIKLGLEFQEISRQLNKAKEERSVSNTGLT